MVYVVECKPDFVLVRFLIYRQKIVHAGNKSRVLRRLTRNYENSIGLIDQDPGTHQPPDLRRFTEILSDDNSKLKVRYFSRSRNFLVVICPNMEEWIIEASDEANVNITEYNLPNDPTELHRRINLNLDKFQRVLDNLKQASNRIKTLQSYLRNPFSLIS